MNKLCKKFLPRTAILTMALSIAFAIASFAAQGKINFSDPSVTVGDEVNVTMKISADEGTSLQSANIVLTYPTDKLEFVSGTDSDGGAGAIRVHGASNGSGTALLEYNLKFKTLSAGSASIGVDSFEVYDSNEQAVEITHQGSSSVTIGAGSDSTGNCDLSSLDVYPGELSPAFDAATDTYSVTVGLGVEKLTINAIAQDSSASVSIGNNESLPEGDSAVTVAVAASDGTASKTYTINVSKVEGGPENTVAETEAPTTDGVQLSSKGKTITIMNPTSDVQIPEGFKQGTIKIDDQRVQGWVWGADAEADSENGPQYCVLYGMNNDTGEINFYRYDMVEKTIQRYFEDPIAAGSVSGAEYNAAVSERDAAISSSNFRFAVICILAAIAFVLLMAVIYLTTKIRTMSRSRSNSLRASQERARKRRSKNEEAPETGLNSDDEDKDILKHEFDAEMNDEAADKPADETQIIRRPERKRRPRRHVAADMTADAVNDNMDDVQTETADAEPKNDELTGFDSIDDNESE